MKIYLAAPYIMKETIIARAAELRAGGIVVTSRWINERHAPGIQMHELTPAEHRQYAIQDVKDVREADIVVFHTDPTKTLVRAGRHVEFGIAIEREVPVYVVGEDYENIFHYMPNVTHFASWDAIRNFLLALAKA